jgi:hypothetical protein
MYNFGNLETEESLIAAKASKDAIEECRKRYKDDKQKIKDGISNILSYIGDNNRYDLSPMISVEDCQEIFVDANGNNVPVTLALTTVMTTLVYLRRAIKRNNLFTIEELNEGNPGLYDKIVETLGNIMVLLLDCVLKNKYAGWGVTVNSKQVTLSDTYVVVDAISRYADAFTQSGAKNDEQFVAMVDEIQFKKNSNYEDLSNRLISSMYKVAYSTYERAVDKNNNVYGQSIFYADGPVYTPTTYEQISSSNRSSALFNPLYVAMITMYGYNEKEIVIRKFMDDYALMKKYYDIYEVNAKPGELTISEYSKTLKWFTVEDPTTKERKPRNFDEEKNKLLSPHPTKSSNYDIGDEWREYYEIARVFQKFIEVNHPDELLKINEYRDYLNATKDAIDQVQVMYRKFNDRQRLGIVDTDYVMFNSLDIETDAINISKLNKANIAVNSLRPLLLSSKIMIVNALTKYPQSDMSDLYNAIKDSKHRKSAKRVQTEDSDEWLWNEDKVDMNSTMRHCEAIAYDYFDYYEKYELGFKAMSRLKSDVSEIVVENIKLKTNSDNAVIENVSDSDGALVLDAVSLDDNNVIKELILNVTRQNVDKVKESYQKNLSELKDKYEKIIKEKDDELQKREDDRVELVSSYERKTDALKRDTEIGSTLKTWIRDETQKYLKEILSYIVIDKINNNTKEAFGFDRIINDDLCHGGFDGARELLNNLKTEYHDNEEYAISHYETLNQRARELAVLLEATTNGILDAKEIRETRAGNQDDTERGNAEIAKMYNTIKEGKDGILKP